MPVLTYTAKDQQGQLKKGTVEALDPKKAAEVLAGSELTPITIKEQKTRFSLREKLGGGVSGKQLVAFTRQLATMVSAGLPLPQSLQTLETQTDSERLREVIADLVRAVEGGSPLSLGMEKHSKVFSPVYVNLVKVGEASGKLDTVLLNLADTVEKSYDFKSKVRTAMVYPTMIMLTMLVVFTFLFVFVVPQLAQIYENFERELPIQTKLVIAISDLLTQRGWLVILLLIMGVVSFVQFKKTELGKYFLARLGLKFPIIGHLRQNVEITEFTRTLGLLVQSGVPILQAMEIATQSMNNLLFREGVLNATKQVERGVSIAVALSNTTTFPPMVTQMIGVGERTGKLDEVLRRLSEFLQKETNASVDNLATALEPIILVVLGAMVGFLVMSIILPIYDLTSSF